ncbi:hypothetical protein [Kalamiella sp. sgz302252]|uniref:hypothetical protein n=1 Tax=Pantoea sp. sgz302252 TaxID=3341827 RepID=UPI0036D36627
MRIAALTVRFLLLPLAIASGAAWGAENCSANAKRVNDSNGLLLLGGTAQGPVKQVVMGEFGKDVNRQRRILGEFDRCGSLLRADISMDKNEGDVVLKMAQNITRIASGWQAIYEMSVFARQKGELVEVHNKQGIINYLTGKAGTITSSSETFLLQGEKGFTETTNSYDDRQRLIKSVARGSDAQANGEYHYQWNAKDQLIASSSAESEMKWRYDDKNREKGLYTRTHNPNSELTVLDECQLWDEHDNCTLNYSHEREVFAQGEVVRNISAAWRFEYWDTPQGEK